MLRALARPADHQFGVGSEASPAALRDRGRRQQHGVAGIALVRVQQLGRHVAVERLVQDQRVRGEHASLLGEDQQAHLGDDGRHEVLAAGRGCPVQVQDDRHRLLARADERSPVTGRILAHELGVVPRVLDVGPHLDGRRALRCGGLGRGDDDLGGRCLLRRRRRHGDRTVNRLGDGRGRHRRRLGADRGRRDARASRGRCVGAGVGRISASGSGEYSGYARCGTEQQPPGDVHN